MTTTVHVVPQKKELGLFSRIGKVEIVGIPLPIYLALFQL